MAFCANCGHTVEEYDKFCPRCGAATRKDYFTGAGSENGRKESYDGELKKCPNCGEVLKSFTPNCPTCGYELRNITVTNSVKELSNKIQQIEATKPRGKGVKSRLVREEIDKEIKNLVISFPIPNTREDILEFMILAASNAETSDVWIPKIEQAYKKAQTVFGTEPEYFQIEEIYKESRKRIKRKSRKDARDLLWMIGGFFGFLALLAIIAYIAFLVRRCSFPKENEEEESRLTTIVQEAESALSDHDYKLALRIVESMKYEAHDNDRKRWWGIKKESMIEEIIDEANKAGVELERTTEAPPATSEK